MKYTRHKVFILSSTDSAKTLFNFININFNQTKVFPNINTYYMVELDSFFISAPQSLTFSGPALAVHNSVLCLQSTFTGFI